jgi:hypothetical protein
VISEAAGRTITKAWRVPLTAGRMPFMEARMGRSEGNNGEIQESLHVGDDDEQLVNIFRLHLRSNVI